LESDPARHQRRVGKLGQTRAHRQRARTGIIKKHDYTSIAQPSRVMAIARL
jgi:hypothetical protein